MGWWDCLTWMHTGPKPLENGDDEIVERMGSQEHLDPYVFQNRLDDVVDRLPKRDGVAGDSLSSDFEALIVKDDEAVHPLVQQPLAGIRDCRLDFVFPL